MALGYRAAEKVYQETLDRITKSREEWISFLNSSTWMFEYTFGEQLLIYAQRPEARACASMEDWNKKASRWIKRNSKGITIMKYENGQNKLELLFDIADTYPIHDSNVGLWKLDKNRQWRELTYTLVSKYGDFKKKNSLEESLVSAIDNFIEDSLIEYFEEFKNIANKSSLTGVDEEELKFIYTETIRQNLIYTVFTRCDLDPFTVLPNYNFEYITYFDSVDTINNIGVATRDLSRDMIREIRAFVKNKKERGDLNEHRIQSSERLSNTEYRNREQRNSNNGQIRTNEGEILERKQTMYVRANEDDRNTNTTLELDTENLRGESSKINRTNETTREYNRGNEREKSNAVGRNDEQLENDSRVDDTRRNDIQLDSLLSEDEQKQVITGVENTSVFSFTQEMIDSVLQEGSNFAQGKFRIYEQLTSLSSSKENIEFLKREYGIGGRSADSNGINEDHSPKGIVLRKGYNEDSPQLKLSWNEVEKRIKELIRLDRYLNSKEKEEYERWLLNEQETVVEIKEDNKEKEFLYLKGDKVFIGSIEYEIVVISSKEVLLSEVQYPLLVKEMSFEEFDRKAKENPYNTHLIRSNRTEKIITDNKENIPEEIEDTKSFIENIYFKCYSDLEIYVYENPNNKLLEVELKDEEKYSPQLVLTHILNEIENGTFNVTESEKSRILEELKNVRKQEKEYVIGKTVNYDNGIYTIKDVIEVNDGEDEVVLENNETKEKTTDIMGFAIYLVGEQENKEKEKIEIPKIKKQRKSRIEHYDLHPEIPLVERNNYKIINNDLGVGTPKEKYARNIEAIKVLKKCQEENRYATKEEQKVLANYVGWGGLADVFDRDKSNWSNEYEELKQLLTEKEYEQARQSTLTAFYTPPVVIKAIYKALENMGLEEGNILEPSCGIGNFMGMLPDTLNKCKIYGVEIDSITGEIARQLYQKNTIAVKGFEKVEMPDSFFDVAVGNVPFGNYPLADKRYDKNNFLIHDYFFAKTLDKVRPDGVIAFITSKGTMDKKNNSFRKYIAQRAELLGAIRLPNDVFTDNAGTKTTTDIIFLQRKSKITEIEPSWINLGIDKNGIEMNQYFIDNPEMILGEMQELNVPYKKYECVPISNVSLEEKLNDAIKNINTNIKNYEIDEISIEDTDTIPAIPTVRNYTYAVVDDKIYYRENSIMYLQEVPLTTEKRIKSMVEIRDSLRSLIELQTEDASDEEIKQEQEKLNSLYDKFTATYGIINSRANEKAFAEDDSYYLLCSLEILKENGEFDRKADMFYKRTIKATRQVLMADNAVDALILSISNKACVDMEYMKSLTGKSEEELVKDLEGSIYKDPIDEIYVTADEYLSGNVREKLKIAQKFAENDDSFKANVEALEKVKPTDLTASEISVKLGTTWIPTSDIEDFIYELLDTSNYLKYSIKVKFSEYTSEWNITGKSEDRGNVKANHTYGTSRINAYKIIENTLNLRDVKIFDNIINADGKEERVFNAKETAIAQARQELIKNKFQDWIWKDQARRERLVNFYNENFNNIKLREYDGQYIVFNGMNPEITLKKHQLDAVARILYGGNTLLAHEVRSRKNF